MVTSAGTSSHAGNPNPNPNPRALGFFAQAIKRKDSFIQFFLMTGILILSMRSLGQKYRIKDLQDENSFLTEEQASLSARMASLKRDLLNEAALDETGLFASKLDLLFDSSLSSD